MAMIDQTTVGHQFLNDSFGFTPIIGWQIDPFGHSSTQASLMCASLGFNALYFARTDYQVPLLTFNVPPALAVLTRSSILLASLAHLFSLQHGWEPRNSSWSQLLFVAQCTLNI